jgi:hypothetical protein
VTGSPPTIQIVYVPGCMLVDRLRSLVAECLADVGAPWPVEVVTGQCHSPTLLVNGVDITTGRAIDVVFPACRVDLPTKAEILAALGTAGD